MYEWLNAVKKVVRPMMNWTSATSDRSSEHLQHFLNVNVFLRIFCHPFPVLRRKCLFCVEFLLAVIFLVTCNNSRSCYREILSIFSWGRNDKKKTRFLTMRATMHAGFTMCSFGSFLLVQMRFTDRCYTWPGVRDNTAIFVVTEKNILSV